MTQNPRRFTDHPTAFVQTFGPEVAKRTTYTTRPVGLVRTAYAYTVHKDRDLAYRRCNDFRKDTSRIHMVMTD